MRYMLLLKGDLPAGSLPDAKLIQAMTDYSQEMVRAGVLLSAEGLHPSADGARVVTNGGRRTVVDGPFTESKELVAGYYLIQVKSKEEAIEWASRCPVEVAVGDSGREAVVEVRLVAEPEDLPTEPASGR
jgi:hypothetical protein